MPAELKPCASDGGPSIDLLSQIGITLLCRSDSLRLETCPEISDFAESHMGEPQDFSPWWLTAPAVAFSLQITSLSGKIRYLLQAQLWIRWYAGRRRFASKAPIKQRHISPGTASRKQYRNSGQNAMGVPITKLQMM